MKYLFSLFVMIIGFQMVASAKVETVYETPKKFTDLELTDRSKGTTQRLFDKTLKSSRRLAASLGSDDRVLLLTFTDIDLAGEILPVRSGKFRTDRRVIRSVYPPRLEFKYSVLDASGNEILSGEENLVDIDFQFRIAGSASFEPFYYEIKALEEWAAKTVGSKK